MAACIDCGEKAGFGKKKCESCIAKENAKRAEDDRVKAEQAKAEQLRLNAEKQERARLEEEARQQRIKEFLQTRIEELSAIIDEGLVPYLYRYVTINSDSYFNESPNPQAWTLKTHTGQVGAPPNLAELQSLGWQGWELTTAVPITFGSTLYNTAGGNTSYAAAHSGLVVGSNLLLRLPITKESLIGRRKLIEGELMHEFPG
jgi:hypothetical protein